MLDSKARVWANCGLLHAFNCMSLHHRHIIRRELALGPNLRPIEIEQNRNRNETSCNAGQKGAGPVNPEGIEL